MNRARIPRRAMINNIAASGVHAADIAALRKARARKTESAQDTGKTQKPPHRAHPHGHIPPGFARAAEKIAAKIFARADADGNGTVTQQELSAVHSRHARSLASSDLFSEQTTETPENSSSEPTPTATTESGTEAIEVTEASSETETTAENSTETSTPAGVTESQLKEALTRFFYSKVGVIYTPPSPTTAEPASTEAVSTPPVDEPNSDESGSNPPLVALAGTHWVTRPRPALAPPLPQTP